MYTSPHYVDYRERIRVDGAMISEDYVVAFVAEHHDLIERTGASFFEFTVAMAFAYFAAQNVDVAVIEVGMGGRLDSTNVITPLVSVITNIGLDHTEVLGETLELIACEKAGIMKPGIPTVIGRYQAETWPVFEGFAERLNSKLQLASDLIEFRDFPNQWLFQRAAASEYEPWNVLVKAELSIRGPYALENVRTAIAAFELFRTLIPDELGLPDYRCLTRMEELSGYRGRFMSFRQNPQQLRIIADAAHNVDGWRGIVPAVVAETSGRPIHVVCGFVQGKAPTDFVSLWPRGTSFYIGQLDLPRAQAIADTLDGLRGTAFAKTGYPSIAEAYTAALNAAAPDELIFVGGSSFVVGEFLQLVAQTGTLVATT